MPINLLSPDLFQNRTLSPEEADFLIGSLSTDTVIDQAIISGFVTGELPQALSLPGGPIGVVLGGEWREDSINTQGDSVFTLGLAAGRNSDLGAQGTTSQWELFGEVGLPILKDLPFAQELTVTGSGRFIDNEFFGQTGVWSVTGRYRPTDWLLFRGTAGTSFRAPDTNLLFLGGQSGFAGGGLNPCNTPAGDDGRSQIVLDNCTSLGIDPLNFFQAAGFETFTTGTFANGDGAPSLDPERSDNFTAGFVLSNPWDDIVGADISFSWFSIEIEDGIQFPGAGAVVANCFNQPAFNSPFCANITFSDSIPGFIETLNTTPLNLDEESIEGIDLSLRLNKEISLFGSSPIRLFANLAGTRILTNEIVSDDGLGNLTTNFENGEFGDPRWRGTLQASANWEQFTFSYNAQYASGTTVSVDPVADGGPFIPGQEADNGIDVFNIPSRVIHNFSFIANVQDDLRLSFGIRNAFNRQPDRVDSAFDSLGNVVLGTPVTDILGRRFTVGFVKEF